MKQLQLQPKLLYQPTRLRRKPTIRKSHAGTKMIGELTAVY